MNFVDLKSTTMNGSNSIIDYYTWTWSIIDHRVDGWLLMSSEKPIILLILSYFAGTYVGYKFMRDRKSFDLKWPMVIYNIAVAILNLYIVMEFLVGAIASKYNWVCDVTNSNSKDPNEMRVANGVFLYMISKEIEWLDTAFFILRKSDRQLTRLHIYHHTTTAIIGWMVCRWAPTGSTFFPLMINSAVHVIMYTYYGLAALGTNFQKYLWWKRYLTQIQMIQFVAIMTQSLNGLRIGCRYTVFIQYLMVGYMISFLILFGMFYNRTYTLKKPIANRKMKESKELGKESNGHVYLLNGTEVRHRTATSF